MSIENKLEEKDLCIFNKVMALSDIDICRHLAVIEGLQTYEQYNYVRVLVEDGDDYYFDPLSDANQCVALLKKHNVERKYAHYDFIGWSYHVLDGINPLHVTERQDFDGSGEPDISFQKAVCLAIILNKSEAFKLN